MQTAVRISNRQFNLIKEIQAAGGITLDRLLKISQTTAGGTVRRGWFKWNPSRALFNLTKEGESVISDFNYTYIDRKNHKRPLSSFIKTGNLNNLRRKRYGSLEKKSLVPIGKTLERKGYAVAAKAAR